MEISLARVEDLSAVANLDPHIPVSRLAECIRSEKVYVLRAAEQIAGVLRFSLFWQTIPFLDLIFLAEAHRNNGWGTQMMEHWEKAMRSQGFRHVMLSTQEDETARFFYEKLGYRRIGAFLPPEQAVSELMYLKAL